MDKRLIERVETVRCVDGNERGRCEECDLRDDLVTALEAAELRIAELKNTIASLPPVNWEATISEAQAKLEVAERRLAALEKARAGKPDEI